MNPKKRYRSALRSERLIRNAYVELSESEAKVSVTAICRAAGLNRSTFYAHYESVEDLEAKLVSNLMDCLTNALHETLTYDVRENPDNLIKTISAHVAQNKSLYKLQFTSAESTSFSERLRSELLAILSGKSVSDRVRFDYIVGGTASVYRAWVLNQYGTASIDEITALIIKLLAS